MILNRLIDEDIDLNNKRTKVRSVLINSLGKKNLILISIFSILIYLYFSYLLSITIFLLSFIPLFLTTIYSYCKRFTWIVHGIIGIIHSAIYIGIEISFGFVDIYGLLLSLYIFSIVTADDIFYSISDYEFDKEHNLKSLHTKFGLKASYLVISSLYLISLLSMLIFINRFLNVYFVITIILLLLLIYIYKIHSIYSSKTADIFKITRFSNILITLLIIAGVYV